jgi:hypothetical protein
MDVGIPFLGRLLEKPDAVPAVDVASQRPSSGALTGWCGSASSDLAWRK